MKKIRKETIGARELAEYMDVNINTVKSDAEAGRIPCMKVGSRGIYRFVLDDVLAAYQALAVKK